MVDLAVQVDESIIQQMRLLCNKIKYYDYELHYRNNNIVSEAYYDSLRKELEDLEEQYNYILSDSPSLVIGCVLDTHNLVSHTSIMSSLKCAYNKEDVYKHAKMFNTEFKLIVEPKIDGVALSLKYEEGICISAALRGDGKQGENVLPFMLYTNAPLFIENFSGEIRGEVYTDNVSNHRNIVAGILRNKQVQNYNLKFVAYKIISNNKNNHIENLKWLSQYFEIPKYYIVKNIEDAIVYAEQIWKESYKYPIDGSVIKSEYYNYNMNNRYAKDAFSYKYINNYYQSIVEDIKWSVNRSGEYIPRCKIQEIIIDGAKINYINGHNFRFLNKNKIGIGAIIQIERVGNIVPQYISTIQYGENIILDKCVYCNNLLSFSEIHAYCLNCPERIYQQTLYFFKQLNIKYLNENILRRYNQYPCIEIIKILKNKEWITNLNDRKVHDQINNIKFTYLDIINALGISGASRTILNKYFNKSENEYTDTDRYISNYIQNHQEIINQLINLLCE